MRMTAPAISAALLVLAAAFVWYFRPEQEVLPESGVGAVTVQPASAVSAPTAREADTQTLTSNAPTPAAVPVAATTPAPHAPRSPLPGETAATPMANLLVGREPRPGVAESERDFAAEPVDATWAPGAEADLLARFAQMPGLTLTSLQVHCRSTMCRLEVVQPGGAPPAEGGQRPFSILRDSVGLEPRWMMQIGDRSHQMWSVAFLWRDGLAPKPPPGPANETN